MAGNAAKLATLGMLGNFFDNVSLADFTVVCRDSTWAAHRLALSMCSRVLAIACDGGFKEAIDREIDLFDHDAAHIKALLEYIYKSDYHGADTVVGNVKKMVFHVNMCFVGDKYDISELQNVSIRKFQSVIAHVELGDELAEVSELAYSGPNAVRAICDSIVDHIFEKDLVTACSDNKQLEKAM